jgi:hypothetical protein
MKRGNENVISERERERERPKTCVSVWAERKGRGRERPFYQMDWSAKVREKIEMRFAI